VQVHYDEGVANHIGPEPCAGIREDVGEASVGERAGQPLSRDRKSDSGCRRCLCSGRQYVQERQRKHLDDPAWSKNLARTHASAREPGDPTSDQRYVAGLVRIGKARSRSR